MTEIGSVLLVNRCYRTPYFTQRDARLAQMIGRRLAPLIEKLDSLEAARAHAARAEHSSHLAEVNAERAQRALDERDQNLLVLTHQMLGSLANSIRAVTGELERPMPAQVRSTLEFVHVVLERLLRFSTGAFTVLARITDKSLAKARRGDPVPVEKESIKVLTEARRLVETLRRIDPRKDLSFRYVEEDGFPHAYMNRFAFDCAMDAVISNALKYADRFETVTIECGLERQRNVFALKIKSVGVPIMPGEVHRIFERFERGAKVKQGARAIGAGLGLWIARELLLMSGADIRVELSHVNERLSVFVVDLPTGPTTHS